ncbi:MAG TPA: PQQ-binding-like beta-propeller repeat protein [Pirellulales bacterium]|jgi:outer membrane protein assembly factor BamB|nr:PQQ-binding-like beta-propeller repeat protein [Pirellulales bacterium]
MTRAAGWVIVVTTTIALWLAPLAQAQDWPQWRGPNRDAKVTGFQAPATWPKELTQKWKLTVGDGVATPALVGDKLYVFARQNGNEIIRCLNAATGEVLWHDENPAEAPTGNSAPFPGPRSSPTVGEGKLITLGVRGELICYEAASGKKLWAKNDFAGNVPRFFTSASPIIADGQCLAQLGGAMKGAIVSYDLNSGDEKWRWTGDGTAYASPMMLTVEGQPFVVTLTEKSVVAISPVDQKVVWSVPYSAQRGGYNAATPIIDSNIVIFSGSGRGTKAVKFEKKDGQLAPTELWSNSEISVQFDTPVLKDGLLYGFTATENLFCLSATDGKTMWTTPRMEGGGGRSGYGSIVDCGPVLMALTPAANLMVFEPSDKELKPLANYKVADSETHAYPVVSRNRIFIKDKNDVILWTIE